MFWNLRLIVEPSCCSVDSEIVGSLAIVLKCVVSLEESLIVVSGVEIMYAGVLIWESSFCSSKMSCFHHVKTNNYL